MIRFSVSSNKPETRWLFYFRMIWRKSHTGLCTYFPWTIHLHHYFQGAWILMMQLTSFYSTAQHCVHLIDAPCKTEVRPHTGTSLWYQSYELLASLMHDAYKSVTAFGISRPCIYFKSNQIKSNHVYSAANFILALSLSVNDFAVAWCAHGQRTCADT